MLMDLKLIQSRRVLGIWRGWVPGCRIIDVHRTMEKMMSGALACAEQLPIARKNYVWGWCVYEIISEWLKTRTLPYRFYSRGESEFSHNPNAMAGDGVTVHGHDEFVEFVNMTGDEFLEFVDVVRRSCSHEFPEFGAIGVRVMSSWNL